MPWVPPHRTVDDPGATRNFESLSGQVDNLDQQIATVQTSATTAAPTGALTMFAGAAAPTGWLLCQGQSLTQAAYPALYALITNNGTVFPYGGSGTNFNLPDLQGRMPVGRAGTGGNGAVTTLGANDGTALGSRQPAHPHSATLNNNTTGISIPSGGSHNHTITDPGHSHSAATAPQSLTKNFANRGSGSLSTMTNVVLAGFTGTGSSTTGITINTTNSSHSHSVTDPGHGHTISVGTAGGTSNAPSYIVVTFIIKT